MSANIKLLKTRIKSVDSTLHLTRAMQLVAASKIRKATEKLAASRSYLDAFGTVMAHILQSKLRKFPAERRSAPAFQGGLTYV